MSRFPVLILILAALSIASCDSNDSPDDCLTVTPNEGFTLSGDAGTMNFIPASKSYVVRNTCDDDVDISIDEDERWLDVDIVGFSSEGGTLSGGGNIDVVVEVVYGSDNPERLDQLAAGAYTAEVEFVDETNDRTITRAVNLTVK